MLCADPSELAGLDPIQTGENLRDERLEIGQAIGRSLQEHDANGETLQNLLVREIGIDGDEGTVVLARPFQKFAILQPGPSGFGHGRDFVV